MAKPIRVEGLRDLERNLRALQKEYGGKAATQAMRPALKAAIDPLKGDIAQDTPVDSGNLQATTKVAIGKPNKKMLATRHYNATTVIAGRVGWFWRSRSYWYQAIAMEFGTRGSPALNILRGTFDREHMGMLNRFKTALGPAIEKKAKSLKKKRFR